MSQLLPIAQGPIFLDGLRCSGTESSLLDCNRGLNSIGLTTCTHSDDVWIQCTSKHRILIWMK